MLTKPVSELTDEETRRLLRRGKGLTDVMATVVPILDDVKRNGDAALRKYTQQFDKAKIEMIEVLDSQIDSALSSIDDVLIRHLEKAAANIRKFHIAQLQKSWMKEFDQGIKLGQHISPLDSVGAYVPGGRATYPSTALMTVIPAKVAGVENVVVCTPPKQDGSVNPLTLAAASIAGADRVFCIGGVQAVAAMAYGTETVPKVDKIVGPGNVYVTAAKMACGTAIDFPAGPSELLIIADSSSKSDHIAADMIAQAEHDPDAVCVLVTTSDDIAKKVRYDLDLQMKTSARLDIISKSLDNAAILTGTLDECICFSNRFAPEHLEIMTDVNILGRIKHAGSIFIGNYAPVSAGDYASGTNHVLPTAGYARVFSGLNTDHFVTKSSVQIIDKKGLDSIGDTIIDLAEAEGLPAHANAVRVRK
ncbi:MAG: histidinol dehydrogenase [Euryarchaeota archaeon]|nr:histidinol dehydrogenase [Euryarchaeota archaeon]MBU4139850.1 histidinol dehydrogenase [Euryarchaeota archaeon]